jgi:hypothetical protein
MTYPGSHPRGGGSLHPASNLVYDHNGVYRVPPYAGNEEVNMQVDKPRSNGKKEKEKIHVFTGEWRIIMSAINHGTEVPVDSRREVLMGYQYALQQRRKKLREEKDMFMRSQDNNSASTGGYWDEYSDASESSIERRRDPKHSRRTTNMDKRRKPYEKYKRTPIR